MQRGRHLISSLPARLHQGSLPENLRSGGRRSVSTLILLRHGQSIWNGDKARFTGWCDVPLTVRGRVQAVAAGQLLRARGFKASKVDVAFTSGLQRAVETCELALASMAGPDQHTWDSKRIRKCRRLNERHYGSLQGRFKSDQSLITTHGEETVRSWRRSMHAAPPPMEDGHPHWAPPPAPTTESLADCQVRVVDCFKGRIAPALFDEEGLPTPPEQRTVVVVAHSNTIRSLMAFIDKVPPDAIPKLHVPNSVPILYRFNSQTRRPISTMLQGKAGGSHARWLLSPDNHAQVREALQPGGMLTRAMFDAFCPASMADLDEHVLTIGELEQGITALIKEASEEGKELDCAVMGVAKKIVRELYSTSGDKASKEIITLADFERLAHEAVSGLQQEKWWDADDDLPQW